MAKNPLKMADRFVPVLRGRSRRPLFVSAVGCPMDMAAERVSIMHGAHRIPTLLRMVDQDTRV